jgi:hypothetical protein
MADNELLTEFKLFLSEKGLAGTDASFKSPVVTSGEYHSITKKLREKRKPGQKKADPFKGPIKKLEEEEAGKRWDKFIDRLDKIKDPEKRKLEELKWRVRKEQMDALKNQGSNVRQI